jgi:hypothetical protein
LGHSSLGTSQLAITHGVKLPQLVSLKQATHALLGFGVPLHPSRQLEKVI